MPAAGPDAAAQLTSFKFSTVRFIRPCLLQDPPSAYHTLRQQLASGVKQQQQQLSTTPPQQPHHCQQQVQHENEQGAAADIAQAAKRQRRWPRPADDVCRAISCRLKQAGSAAAVLQVVQHHAEQFNTVS